MPAFDIRAIEPDAEPPEPRAIECPTGKRAYATRGEAKQQAERTNMGRDRISALRPFRCGFCEYYHLGHRRGRVL